MCALMLAASLSFSAARAAETDQEYTIKVPVADDEQGELNSNSVGYFFCTVNNNKVTIIQYTGTAKSITVPKTIAGLAVTKIGPEAFKGTGVNTVTLSSGIRKIQRLAFADTSITKITLPKSITSIAETAFKGATVKTFSAPVDSYAYEWGISKGFISKVNYRALLIGIKRFLRYDDQGYYINTAERNAGDVSHMASMLKKVYGPAGSKYSVKKLIDPDYKKIEKAIKSTFASTTKNDVSLFFIASHGDETNDGVLEMPFLGNPRKDGDIDDYYFGNSFLSFGTLAGWLKKYVKGKVIVIIQSCGAGSAIYDKAEENSVNPYIPGSVFFESRLTPLKASKGGGTEPVLNNPAGYVLEKSSDGSSNGKKKNSDLSSKSDNPEKVVNSAIRAFSSADPGIETEAGEFDLTAVPKTGELRVANKFYVLAASRHDEKRWGRSGSNLFTDWLIEAVGDADYSPADTNSNGILTLNEVFKYIRKYNNYEIEPDVYQHVQVYPVNSSYKLFKFK